VRRQYAIEMLLGLCVDPAADDAATRENKRVLALTIDNGEFHFAVKRRAIYRLPVHAGIFVSKRNEVFDLDHLRL
jgi:hypothetical protein